MPSNTELQKLLKSLNKNAVLNEKVFMRQLLKQYKKSLLNVEKELVALFKKLGDTPTFLEAAPRLQNLNNQISIEIKRLSGKSINITESGTISQYQQNYNGISNALGEAVNAKGSFGLIAKDSVASSILNPYQWQNSSAKYSAKLLSGIKNEVTSGLIEGKSFPKMLKNIQSTFDVAANDAMRILRTELHRAESVARLNSINNARRIADKLGFNLVKIWDSILDRTTRDMHADMDGTPADSEGVFTLPDGVTTQTPGNTGAPQHDVNCRCFLGTELLEK